MADSGTRWIESLSPWPSEGFGLERMRTLLEAVGDPQLAFRSVHVVGTNGKTSTTLMTAALLHAEGLKVGAYISPHVTGWSERIQVDGKHADFETAIARIRPEAERLNATQFEALTAAGLAEFAAQGVDAAVVEAGLGGRLDATNVLRSPVQVLTNVARDHTEVLGETREEIAREKLAVVQPGSSVVLGEPEWAELAREMGAGKVVLGSHSNLGLAVHAAAELLGRPVDPHAAQDLEVPGRLERKGEHPLELWDGAHNIAGVGYLLGRLPSRTDYVIVASILADKNVDAMLRALTAVGDTLVATTSSNERALPEMELAARAEPYFHHVEREHDPRLAVRRARALAGSDGAVLVTGSLYLLADLVRDQ
jgi:dihydrofolate synthase / folylpolyglutamate synthase